MIKFKKVLLVCIGLCIFAAMPPAGAQNTSAPSGLSSQWHTGQRIFSQLNLTDEQKNNWRPISNSTVKDGKGPQAIKAARQALQDELMKTQLDMAKVTALHEQIKALQAQMEDIKLSSILTVRDILTPEQFSKFVNLMHKHKQEHE